MNSKSLANEQLTDINAVLKTSRLKNPSAFVLFSDTRNRSLETPYFAAPQDQYPNGNSVDLATPQSYTTRFSARHSRGGCITFSDGHADFFFYQDVVADGIQNPNFIAGHDPGNPLINWDADGQPVP